MKKIETDLAILGGGLAGLAGAVFAGSAGLKVTVVNWGPGELPLSSGLLDLLGLHPVTADHYLDDPWAGVEALVQDEPNHPYARLDRAEMVAAWESFLSFLDRAGLPYFGQGQANLLIPTPVGRPKATYRVPLTMRPGVEGLRRRLPALLVGLAGMKEFSARQVAANLALTWPGLEATRLVFPFAPPAQSLALEPPSQMLAEALESEPVRTNLAELVKPLLGGAELVGFPAVLGMRRSAEVRADLAARLGREVFEVPTFPPSVPGLRLRDALTSALTASGVTFLAGQPARAPRIENGRVVAVTVGEEPEATQVEARAFLLTTGRFLGRGLVADRRRVREDLFDLPVAQPTGREEWHRESFWDRRGNPLNRAGLEIDLAFRPLGEKGGPAHANLFAAGGILAHQDWVRQKCGAGLALASVWGAVKGIRELG